MNRSDLSASDQRFLDELSAEVAQRIAEHIGYTSLPHDSEGELESRFNAIVESLSERVQDLY